MRIKMYTRVLAVLVLLAIGQAFAAEPHGPASACAKDYRQLCKSVQAGGGRGLACLKEHESELSTQCRAQLQTLAACAPEIKRICGDGAAAAELRTCLKDHAGALSAACRPGDAGASAPGG